MVATVFDKSKSMRSPQFQAPVLKSYRPDGTYHIDVGPILIVMDDKENLIAEWALCESLIAQWRGQGKIADYSDEAFMQFMDAGHQK